ncbi:MAG: UDP-N-acetylmuramoyl-L-alanyl-D-glutamate--2,6-diaminopimelate ligase [Ahrensia sp.]|nr:UDP-N-acetylmuramoyl-L-alanyl-D-glutamate--2,6-diaminopimelate ligase [Ahrensia sp.]
MKLSDLIAEGTLSGTDREVSDLTADSRQVQAGFVFAALPGSTADGTSFIPSAIENGAAAVLCAQDTDTSLFKVPCVKAADPRRELALMAARYFGQQPKVMAAVTGTAGKTSVASFLRQIWAATGEMAAMIGTTGVVAPGLTDYGSLTTPDPVRLHELLSKLTQGGVTHCSMEASSHGLDQRRLDGVRLSVGGFTNLGRDHLDYHATIEDYLAAKMRLFDSLLEAVQPAIVWADDVFSQAVMHAASRRGLRMLTVGHKGEFLALKRVEQQRYAQVAQVEHEGALHHVTLPMAGEFQLANALVATGMAIATGTDVKAAFAALADLQGAPGRLELVGKSKQGAPAYVDYAHKPEALEHVLEALRPYTTGKLILVFGCGGDRDKGKRPIMGEIAQRLADRVIVTDDNPRTEDASSIRAQILAAAPDATEIADRSDAIHAAVAMLGAGDTLVVAGKGHEEGQIVGDQVLPFSDHAVLRAALEESH